jgi:hypothetical protein
MFQQFFTFREAQLNLYQEALTQDLWIQAGQGDLPNRRPLGKLELLPSPQSATRTPLITRTAKEMSLITLLF